MIGTTQCGIYKLGLYEHTKISEMSWCNNVLRRPGSDYYVNLNFRGTFANFRVKVFTQEKINSYGGPCR